ncbi:MAG: type II toxin-antitoxin system VapC family toxin [Desulfobacterales bacterium]|jgi:tRNA(fMet)-specific endonuclease VapC
MRILVDSNRYQDFCEGEPQAVHVIRRAAEIMIPFIVLGELRAGFACGTRSYKNEQTLTRFLNSPRVKQLFADEDTTHQYARLFRQLRKQGTPIPTNDLWIAALALQHDLLLFTRDNHFDHLPQLPVI